MNDQPGFQDHAPEPESGSSYDVAILGGGIAGLTLALQLKKDRPTIKVVVIERQKHPVPEAAHKVGESTVEILAHYLRDVLNLGEHLQKHQLNKFGLRLFFSTGDNLDITQRVELGHAVLPPHGVGTYQLDRGRLENTLSEELGRQGMVFLDGWKVLEVELLPQQEKHRLRVGKEKSSEERELRARWVVDATGRSSLLKRQLGLAKKWSHHANAVWFRLNYPLDINEWSTDTEWQQRILEGERALSTNHLMGHGYWVWLIRLASGSISIGIVTDAEIHPFEEMNRFDRALNWLQSHEPQCAQFIDAHQDKIQDFRVMKDYSYNCEQAFSSDRWCLTGESAVALDPLYSPGGDLIAISNDLVCDLIERDLAGEDMEELAAIHNQIFLILVESWVGIYNRQYSLMGNAQIMAAKIIWDTAVYWAVPGLLYFQDMFCRLSDMPFVVTNLARFSVLSDHVQAFFREWLTIDSNEATPTFIRYYDFDFMIRLQTGMLADLDPTERETQFAANVRFLEQLAGQLVSTVIEAFEPLSGKEAVRQQLESWRNDEFLVNLMALYSEVDPEHPIPGGWITLGRQKLERQEVAG